MPWSPCLHCRTAGCAGSVAPVGTLANYALHIAQPVLRFGQLLNFAWNNSGRSARSPTVQAICDWFITTLNTGTSLPGRSFRVRSDRTPVRRLPRLCHAAIALCGLSICGPLRDRTLADIGHLDSGPDDFHAYCEVYLGQEWLTFDPRFNVPRIGRVKVAHGQMPWTARSRRSMVKPSSPFEVWLTK